MSHPAPTQLLITRSADLDGRPLLTVAGELDMAVTDELGTAAREHRVGGQVLTMDLSGVTFMDSTGVGLLLRLAQEAATDGWGLSVIASPQVWRVVELCGLAETLPVRRPA